ncbi:MAG: hypothetical protein ACRELS_00240 [Candidatus Rokuibacteriota bacterium]
MLIPIALVALALGGLGYGMWYMTSHGTRSEPVAATPAPGAPPQLSADERRAALEALTSLRELRAFAQANPTYQDYAQKTNAAKAPVDKYVSVPNANPELQASFVQAINLYNFASTAWGVALEGAEAASPQDAAPIYFTVANDPMIEVCAPLRDVRNRPGEETTAMPPPVARGIAVTQNVPMIWTCAAERIAYLENILGAN